MKEIYTAIHDYIDMNRENILALWEELVNTESGPEQPEGVNEVAHILSREMEAEQIKTRIIPMERAGNMLIGEWNADSDEKPVLFIGHMDTVFPPGTAKERPFRMEDGKAYGPGVLDMKAGLVIALYAVKALKAAGYTEKPVKFVFAGDEETLHRNSDAKAKMEEAVKGGCAAYNFETAMLNEGFVVGHWGAAIVTVEVTGIPAHSGHGAGIGRSAILEATHIIQELEAGNDITRGKLINCGTIEGGSGINTIPGSCKIGIAARFPDIAIRNEVFETIESAVSRRHLGGTDASYHVEACMDPMENTEGNRALYQKLEKTALDCGYGQIVMETAKGVSDSSIPVVQGVPTLCGTGCKGTGNHTDKEYAEIESIFERSKLIACAVCDL